MWEGHDGPFTCVLGPLRQTGCVCSGLLLGNLMVGGKELTFQLGMNTVISALL